MIHRFLRRACAAVTVLFACAAAQAGEGPFGWTYTLDLQPKGTAEFEQKIDWTHRQAQGTYDLGEYRSELEYGVTDNFQIGAYVNVFSLDAHNNYINPEVCAQVPCTAGFGVPGHRNTQQSYHRFEVDGGSIELIYRLLNPVTSPVGVAVYFEPTKGRLEDELEYRLLLQSNFLDDRLIATVNVLYEQEKEKYDPDGGIIRNSMIDLLYGVNYRFAERWSAGMEGRHHTDHDGYWAQTHTQTANFIGPNVHYAAQKWWTTLAWRHQISGHCYNDGTADCSLGQVWDNHGRDQLMLKFGYLLN